MPRVCHASAPGSRPGPGEGFAALSVTKGADDGSLVLRTQRAFHG